MNKKTNAEDSLEVGKTRSAFKSKIRNIKN